MKHINEIRDFIDKVKNFKLIKEEESKISNKYLDFALDRETLIGNAIKFSMGNDSVRLSTIDLGDLIRSYQKEPQLWEDLKIKVKVKKAPKGSEHFDGSIGWIMNPRIRTLHGTTTPIVNVQFDDFDTEDDSMGGGGVYTSFNFPIEDLELIRVEPTKGDFKNYLKRVERDNDILRQGGIEL